jgi:hypothetical protein
MYFDGNMNVTRPLLDEFVAWVDRTKVRARGKCVDCRMQTLGAEYYIVTDAVWLASGLGKRDGYLCIDCLETRIGRELVCADFVNCEVNTNPEFPRSDRLKQRLGMA